MEIKELAFDPKFRESHPELKVYFDALDALGGRNCKSCDKKRQIRLFTAIKNRLPVEIVPTPSKKVYNDNIVSLEYFSQALKMKRIQNFFEDQIGDEIRDFKEVVDKKGYYDASTENLYKRLYSLYNDDRKLIRDFNEFLDSNKLRDKLYPGNPRCKIVEAENTQVLENLINEFLMGKKLVSVSIQGTLAIIMYTIYA
jgi:hypothetical protein